MRPPYDEATLQVLFLVAPLAEANDRFHPIVEQERHDQCTDALEEGHTSSSHSDEGHTVRSIGGCRRLHLTIRARSTGRFANCEASQIDGITGNGVPTGGVAVGAPLQARRHHYRLEAVASRELVVSR